MEKKIYLKPQTEVTAYKAETLLQSASGEPGDIGGGTNGKGTSTQSDPYDEYDWS